MGRIFCQIVGSSEGVIPGAFYPCESDPGDFERAAESAGLSVDSETIDPTESEYDSGLWKLSEGDVCRSVKVSGVIPFSAAAQFLDDCGAIFEDCETMGTLGGPAFRWAPDFAFTVESQLQVVSIRVCPFLADDSGRPIATPTEDSWGRLRRLFRRDPYDLAKMGSH